MTEGAFKLQQKPVAVLSFSPGEQNRKSTLSLLGAVTIKSDGSIELAEGVSLDAAAQAFWNALARIMPNAPAPAEIVALHPQAAAWRAEAVHRRWLHMDTIDLVPLDLLIKLIDHAYPAATSGYVALSGDTPPHARPRHAAEQEWADVWKRADRPVAPRTSVCDPAPAGGGD